MQKQKTGLLTEEMAAQRMVDASAEKYGQLRDEFAFESKRQGADNARAMMQRLYPNLGNNDWSEIVSPRDVESYLNAYEPDGKKISAIDQFVNSPYYKELKKGM